MEMSTLLGITDTGNVGRDVDNGYSIISGEDYVRFRLQPYLLTFTKKAPRLAMLQRIMQTLLFLVTLASGILGVFRLNILMPVAVSMGAVVQASMDFMNLSTQVRKTNQA